MITAAATKILTAKVLIVTVYDPSGEGDSYEFKVHEFDNGAILVPGETTHDWFFENRDAIESGGLDLVESVQETDSTSEWTGRELLDSIRGSISEFGECDGIRAALQLIK